MHNVKGFLCLALAFCLLFALSVPCFADPVTLSGAEFFMSLWGAYASQHGLGMIFSDNGVQSSPQNPFSVQSYRQAGAQLVEDFLDYSSSIYSDAEEFYDAYKEEVSVTQDVNNQVIMHWSNTLTEWYDQFANWLLGVKYGLTATDSGFDHTSGSFDSPVYTLVHDMDSDFLKVSKSSSDRTVICYYNSGNVWRTVYASADNDIWISFYNIDGVNASWVYVADHSTSVVQYHGNAYDSLVLSGHYGNVYFNNQSFGANSQYNPDIPLYPSLVDALTVANHYLIDGDTVDLTIDLRPKDKYNEDPTANPIPVPDTSDAGYLPAPQDYVLNPSYVGSLPADVTALINSLTDALVENVDPLVAEGDDPAPPSMTPVEIPFLGFTIPSFNLGLSSIWHYVIDWVGSLGSGISFIGSVWNNLPYAMVIPIYASAVVVIVLGMFKRFLL